MSINRDVIKTFLQEKWLSFCRSFLILPIWWQVETPPVSMSRIDNLMNRLDYFRLFHDVPRDDYELLNNSLKTRIFKKGETITVAGQVQRDLFFVKSGVQMSFHDADYKLHVIAFTYAPDLCAVPESFQFQIPSKYFLTCLTESEMDYISFEKLQQLFDQSQQLERLFRRMTESVLAGIINRHIERQSLSMEERYRVFCQRSPHLLRLVPHKYIASYLAIDPTNFSKLFNKIRI